jgi:peptidyl-prolyl cis-trans isomerase B (cyclophilin B)
VVSSDQRRRQLAREKLARQRERRDQARRRKRRNTVIAAAVAVVIASAGAVYLSVGLSDGDDGDKAAKGGDRSTPTAPAEPEVPEPKMAIDAKAPYTMELATDRGTVRIAMEAAKTPRTVNSFKALADKKYFDGTKCHRLVNQGIFVLQCGDPKGDGSGGPGYTIPDENLGALGKAGADGKVTFPAGTVAMANTTQPNTGGSQFFLVYADTKLPPTYTVFGKMDAAGLKAVQAIAKAGLASGSGEGPPKTPVTVEKATVTKG